MRELPEMNVHIDGTPDVPDIVRPGDWLAIREDDDDYDVFVLVVKVFKTEEDEFDYYPGAESWSIQYLGIGYLKSEKVSSHDCGWINGIVAVNGELLELYKLGWNEKISRRVVPKPDGIEVTKSAEALIQRMNATEQSVHPVAFGVGTQSKYPLQLSLFANDLCATSAEGSVSRAVGDEGEI